METGRVGSFHLISPTGVRVAGFAYTLAGFRDVIPLVDGLDCGGPHKNEEQAIKYIVNKYELLTMTRMQRFRRGVSEAFSHGAWAAIAATIAAATGLLNLFIIAPNPIPPPTPCIESPVEVQESGDPDPVDPSEAPSDVPTKKKTEDR